MKFKECIGELINCLRGHPFDLCAFLLEGFAVDTPDIVAKALAQGLDVVVKTGRKVEDEALCLLNRLVTLESAQRGMIRGKLVNIHQQSLI